jgi:hemerythrin-like domain-containing protein
MSTTEHTDAIDLLIGDHRRVEALFVQAEIDATRDAAIKEIVKELSIHAAIEEQVFYPALRKELPDGDQLADHAIEEHQEVKEILVQLDKGAGAETPSLVSRLITSVREHVREEESHLFRSIRDTVKQEQLLKMGEAMATAKKTAPTRPHPHAPTTPPGNVIAGTAAGLVDRARDALRRD